MEEEKIIVDETLEGWKKFYTTFPRDKEYIKIQDYTFRIGYISAGDMKNIRKLESEKKTYEAQLNYILKGLKEWDVVDKDKKVLPINTENISNLPSFIFSHLALVISAKNRDPSFDELEDVENL